LTGLFFVKDMSLGVAKTKGPAIIRPVLPGLKPFSALVDHQFTQSTAVETIQKDPLDEICDLRHQLLLEKAKNMELQQQIEEMTLFLADYGLRWIGGPAPPRRNDPPDLTVFLQKIEEVNRLADRSTLEFSRDGNIASIKAIPKVELGLYDEGFTVDSGELREYGAPVHAAFIRDIMDGFFPAEFKGQYPEGVRFVVSDCRETFKGPPHSLSAHPQSCMEMLAPPTDLGTGDGELRVRIPSLPDVTIKVTKELTFRALMDLIEHHFDIRQFKICSPLMPTGYDPELTLDSAKLFPRGFVFLLFD
jgi:hypothetical protein